MLALVLLCVLITLFGVLFGSLIYWICLDASARGSNYGLLWGCMSVSLLVIVYYFHIYRRSNDRQRPQYPRERLAQTVAFASFTSFLFASRLNGSPDPFSMALYWAVLLVVIFPILYLIVYKRRYKQLTGFMSRKEN